jgi:predicted MFS family arabinose efflux permease
VGLVLSNTGMWFQNLAAAILVYDLTESSAMVGVVQFCQFSATVALTPWSGVTADRADRRLILIRTQLLAALATLGLALATATGGVAPVMVMLAAAVVGISVAFRTPAQLALIPELVARRDLEAGVSLNSLASNLPRAVGPLTASLLVVHMGVSWAFAVNGLAFLASAAAFALLPRRQRGPARTAAPSLLHTLRDVRSNDLLWAVLVATLAFSATADPAYTLTPEFGSDVFGGSEFFVGVLVGSFGAGAAVGALTGPRLMRNRKYALPKAMLIEVAGVGLFAISWNGVVAVVAMLIIGAGFMASVTRAATILQLETGDDGLGRVMAFWALCLLGPRPLVAIPDGLISDLANPRVAAAVFMLPALAGGWYVLRVLRRLDRRGA